MLLEFEDEIEDIILSLRDNKERVTRETIRQIALAVAKREDISEEEFGASDGWVTRFMERHRLSFRRVTNLCSLSDDVLLNRAFEFM